MHTGTCRLRVAKAFNLINQGLRCCVTGDGVGLSEPNFVVRVPVDANMHPASVIEHYVYVKMLIQKRVSALPSRIYTGAGGERMPLRDLHAYMALYAFRDNVRRDSSAS